jgi:L-iditol 2-dehydrogenase
MQKLQEAAVLKANTVLEIEQRPIPVPQSDEVVLRIRAAGICSSDITRVHGGGAYFYPLVPGHEMAGEVYSVGIGCTQEWKTGERAVVYPLVACNACERCQSGRIHLCRQYSYYGSRQDGGFSQFLSVKASNLLRLPQELDFNKAVLVEPLSVVLHALGRAQISSGCRILISGAGTLGQLAVRVLQWMQVPALTLVDRNAEKLAPFQTTIQTICLAETDWEGWTESRAEQFDVFLDFTGDAQTLPKAVRLLAPQGELICAGNPNGGASFDQKILDKILRNEITLRGTWNSLPQTDWVHAITLLAEGLNVDDIVSKVISLAELPATLHALSERRRSRQTSRVVKVVVTP